MSSSSGRNGGYLSSGSALSREFEALLFSSCGGGKGGGGAEADVFGGGAYEDVDGAGFDLEAVDGGVVPGEGGDGDVQGGGAAFARLQVDALEGAQGAQRLDGAAVLQVGVELGDFGTGDFAGVGQGKGHVDGGIAAGGLCDLEVAVVEAGVAEAVAEGVERDALEVLVGVAARDVVLVLRGNAVEAGVDGVGQVAAGVVEAEEGAGNGGAAELARVPCGEDGGHVVVGPGGGERAGVEQAKRDLRVGGVDRFEQALL